MRRSHAIQLFGATTAFFVIFASLLFNAYAMEVQNNNHVQLALVFALAALGGSFGGTTLFWLLFQCDFARRKKMRNMNEKIGKVQGDFDTFKKDVKEIMDEKIGKVQSDFDWLKKIDAAWNDRLNAFETNIKDSIKEIVEKTGSNKDPKAGDGKETSPDKG